MTHPHLTPARSLLLEGGGVRAGLTYPYILRRLDDALPRGLAGLEAVAGTSAGAATAAVVACGYRPDAILRLMRSTDWRAFQVRAWKPWRHLHRIDGARAWVEGILVGAGFAADATFADLCQRGRPNLIVVATEITVRPAREREFCAETTPRVRVADAVLASMAIPGYFQPVEIAGRSYVDGGIWANFPHGALTRRGFAHREICGVRVDRPGEEGDGVPCEVPRFAVALLARLGGALVARANGHIPAEIYSRTVRVVEGTVAATDFGVGAVGMAKLERAAEIGWSAALNRWERAGAEGWLKDSP